MKFSLRAMILGVTAVALFLVVLLAILPPPPSIPSCIGVRLADTQISGLLQRYGTHTILEDSKSNTYSNKTGSCQLTFFDNHLVEVRLSVPVDPTLNIKSPKIMDRIVGTIEYERHSESSGNSEFITIRPCPEVIRELYLSSSYTVGS